MIYVQSRLFSLRLIEQWFEVFWISFRKFEVKCRYAQYKILTSEIIDLKNYFLFYVPSRLFLQRLIVPWVQCFDEFLITVFEIWREVSLCKVQNINEWNDSSAIISSSSVKIVSAALTRTVIWGISNHCFRKFECAIRKWNCPTVIISNITMLSIQNFKEDISYVIIKKVCDLIIVLDGLNGVSMVQTLFNVSLLCSRFNNWKKTNCVLIIRHDNILYHVIIQYCIMIWYNIVSYNIISLQNHVLTSFCLWWKNFF